MASKRDQLHAYRFLSRRNASALLHADTDSAAGPLRRLSGSTLASVVAGLIAALAAGMFGLLRPGGGAWQNGKSLIIATGTGSRYVYLGGVLHPVLNYASALLVLRQGAVAPVPVAAGALDRVPHGLPVGIPGAPDEIPAPGALLSGPWVVCSMPGTDAAGAPRPVLSVSVGGGVPGAPLGTGSALLITAGGDDYLVWNGTRLRLPDYAITALGYSSAAPVPVSPGFLDALPQGPDLAAPQPPGLGGPGPAIGGAASVVGQVYQAGGGYYAVYPDGLAPVTALQARLMLADLAITSAVHQSQPLPLTLAAVQQAPQSARHPARLAGLPPSAPALAPAQAQATSDELCLSVTAAATDTVAVSVAPAAPQTVPGPEPADQLGQPLADSVVVPPGGGALVEAVPSPGAASGTLYLVLGTGSSSALKYPIAGSSVLSDLGLAAAHPVAVPEDVIALVPAGPTLDESAATAIVPPAP